MEDTVDISYAGSETIAADGIISKGDFERRVSPIIPQLRRYSRALTNRSHDSDDLTQDALIKGWLFRSKWQPGTNLKSWLFKIARNTVYGHFRSANNRKEIHVSLDIFDSHLLIRASQSDQLEARAVKTIFQKLPLRARQAILLLGEEGLSYEEVATIMGEPVGTIKARVSRARKEFANLLGAENNFRSNPDVSEPKIKTSKNIGCWIAAEVEEVIARTIQGETPKEIAHDFSKRRGCYVGAGAITYLLKTWQNDSSNETHPNFEPLRKTTARKVASVPNSKTGISLLKEKEELVTPQVPGAVLKGAKRQRSWIPENIEEVIVRRVRGEKLNDIAASLTNRLGYPVSEVAVSNALLKWQKTNTEHPLYDALKNAKRRYYWTPEKIEEVVERRVHGEKTKDIASDLTNKFGFPVSENAVLTVLANWQRTNGQHPLYQALKETLHPRIWTPELIAEAMARRAQGESMRAIANAISETHNTDVGPNAVDKILRKQRKLKENTVAIAMG